MKLSFLAPITRFVSRTALQVREKSPEILTTAGVVGGVVAAVMAVKAAPKFEDVANEFEADIENIKDLSNRGSYSDPDQAIKDKGTAYGKMVRGFLRVYGPSIVLGASSACSIFAAHGILKKRNALLVAAYASLEGAFSEYRSRVVEEYGKEKDSSFLIEKSDSENAENSRLGPIIANPYSRFFDEYSVQWTKDAEYNLAYLLSVQSIFNDQLKSRGHVFLNEVLDRLGFDHTATGAITGWIYGGDGDNYIDFGLDASPAFVNGFERSVLLDFNVDGIIYDLI